MVRLQLARMRPGIHILPHTDRGQWAVHAHRIHIPITTGPDVHFDVRRGRRSLCPILDPPDMLTVTLSSSHIRGCGLTMAGASRP